MKEFGETLREQYIRRRCAGAVVMLTLWSLLAALLILSAANDLYAFIKPDRSLTLELRAEETPWSLSLLLSEEGIIDQPLLFSLYLRSEGITEFSSESHELILLHASMSYREILTALKKGTSS